MMPYDATQATTASSRQEALLLPTPTFLRNPSYWHVCPHDGPSWPSSGPWQLGRFDPSSCAADAHSSRRDALCGDQSVENEEPLMRETWEWRKARKSKQRLPPTKKFIGQNMSHDPAAWQYCGNSIINWG